MRLDLRKLNHLVTVARLGTFSRAAEELHISQPALSRSIAGIEDQYGIRIFDRGRNGATLTPAGKLAIDDAELLLRRARTLENNLHLYGTGNAGQISFGMGPMVASLILPSLSIRMMNQEQRLNVHATVNSAAQLLDDLKNDRIEMLFCGIGQMPRTADTRVEVLGSIPMGMLLRRGHPLTRNGGRVTQDELFQYPILSAVELSTSTEHRIGGSFICGNYDVLKDTVLETDSVWVSSPLLVKREMELGLITTIDVIDLERPGSVDICLARLEGSKPSPAADRIIEFVRGYLSRNESH